MNRPPLLSALLHPVNLAMFALSIAAGLCSAWWLAPVGFLFWLVMVVVVAREPGLKLTFTRQARQQLAQRFQTRFDRLGNARISILKSLHGEDPGSRRAIAPDQCA